VGRRAGRLPCSGGKIPATAAGVDRRLVLHLARNASASWWVVRTTLRTSSALTCGLLRSSWPHGNLLIDTYDPACGAAWYVSKCPDDGEIIRTMSVHRARREGRRARVALPQTSRGMCARWCAEWAGRTMTEPSSVLHSASPVWVHPKARSREPRQSIC
jgi:hypothetical protein